MGIAHDIAHMRARLDEIYGFRDATQWEPHERRTHLPLPASEAAIVAFEARHGIVVPPSYRELLRLHDGWDNALWGTTWRGVDRPYPGEAEVVEAIAGQRASLETELGELTPASIATWEAKHPSHRYLPDMLIVGVDFRGGTWLFDTRKRRDDGELPVGFWTSESGLWFDKADRNFPTFAEMLGFLRLETDRMHARVIADEKRKATKPNQRTRTAPAAKATQTKPKAGRGRSR